MISRRSELRALRLQITEQEQKIEEIAEIATSLEQQVSMHEQLANDAADAYQAAQGTLAEQRLRIHAAQQRREHLHEQQDSMQAEFQTATAQVEIVTKSLQSTRQRLEQLQASLAQAEARMSDNSRRIEELDAARQQRNRDCLSAQVELARSEQQLDHLRGQLRRYEQDRHERDRTIAEAREHMTESDMRRQEAELRILAAESELTELYLTREALAIDAERLIQQREEFRQKRAELLQTAQRQRGASASWKSNCTRKIWPPMKFVWNAGPWKAGCGKITGSNWNCFPSSRRRRKFKSVIRLKPKLPSCGES